jgi:N-methylhydantoinase A
MLAETQCHFRLNGDLQALATPLYEREKLPVEQAIEGPAIILQKDTTTVIPPGAIARLHTSGNLLIETGA